LKNITKVSKQEIESIEALIKLMTWDLFPTKENKKNE
jgi:hypothetical protein